MKKTKLVVRMLLFILIVAIAYLAYDILILSEYQRDKYNVAVNNKTNTPVEGLKITYEHASDDVEIPTLMPNQNYEVVVHTNESFSESSMKIYYHDKLSTRHEETIIGYFEKGHSGSVEFNIISVDKEGIIKIQVTKPYVY